MDAPQCARRPGIWVGVTHHELRAASNPPSCEAAGCTTFRGPTQLPTQPSRTKEVGTTEGDTVAVDDNDRTAVLTLAPPLSPPSSNSVYRVVSRVVCVLVPPLSQTSNSLPFGVLLCPPCCFSTRQLSPCVLVCALPVSCAPGNLEICLSLCRFVLRSNLDTAQILNFSLVSSFAISSFLSSLQQHHGQAQQPAPEEPLPQGLAEEGEDLGA